MRIFFSRRPLHFEPALTSRGRRPTPFEGQSIADFSHDALLQRMNEEHVCCGASPRTPIDTARNRIVSRSHVPTRKRLQRNSRTFRAVIPDGGRGLRGAGLLSPCKLGERADQPNDQRADADSIPHVRYVRYRVLTLS